MLLNPFTLHQPKTIAEAAALLTDLPHSKLLAGGSFLLNNLKQLKRRGIRTPEHIISLKNIYELKGITTDGNRLVIKSMTTLSEILESPLLDEDFSVLKKAARNIATTPIRNTATVGGNLTCRYTWTEMPAVMIALEAEFHLVGAYQQEQAVSSEEFFKNGAKTDKILSHITIRRDKSASLVYARVTKSGYLDVPLVSLCLKTCFEEGHFTKTSIAVNNAVEFAQRDRALEEFLNNRKVSQDLPQETLAHLNDNLYDVRADDYKKHIFRVTLKNALAELIRRKDGRT